MDGGPARNCPAIFTITSEAAANRTLATRRNKK